MRSAASSGWSPNSWAIRLMQPPWPSRRTVWPIISVRATTVSASDRCNPDANSASHRVWFMFNRFMASLLAVPRRPHPRPAYLSDGCPPPGRQSIPSP